jgi:hypothetical protein
MKNFYDEPPRVIYPKDNSKFTDAVLIPLAQAIITAVLIGLATGIIAAWLGWPGWKLGITAGCLTAVYSWLSYRGRWAQILERLLGVDLNNDGFVGAPDPGPMPPVRVELLQDEGRAVDYIDLPASKEQLRELADGLQVGRQFALTAWAGPNRPFTRVEFEALRDALIARGLAKWKREGAPNQGCELTRPGAAVLRRFASDTTRRRLTPPPPADYGRVDDE